MNKIFKKLHKPRITKFVPDLIGKTVPHRTKNNSAVTGNYIDQLVKQWAGQTLAGTSSTVVDLASYGIEVKSQDYRTDSDWSIGSMTFQSILDTEYVNSTIYEKLQALLLIRYDNDRCIITDMSLHYLDNDDAQSLICEAYEGARREMQRWQNQQELLVKNQLFVFDDHKPKFKNSQQFKDKKGYKFEYANSGTSFKFRISNAEMVNLSRLASAHANTTISFG